MWFDYLRKHKNELASIIGRVLSLHEQRNFRNLLDREDAERILVILENAWWACDEADFPGAEILYTAYSTYGGVG